MTNIFRYAQKVDCHPVTNDSTKEDAFIVHLLHKQVKFMREWTICLQATLCETGCDQG